MAPEIASHRETQNEPPLTLGSLFDGIGVFPLAASRHGIVPLWASEIEKAPISITRRHFPEMEHLGDITKMDGGQIPAVHILTFGSPCQNLSQIGDRSGLAGAKSSLFHHAIRIIKEMRCATGGQFPIIALWENVMGALSSNDRLDFLAVLRSFQDAPPRFQFLPLVDGQMPEWCEGDVPIWPGGLWTPNTGQAPAWHDGSVSFSWQILEGTAGNRGPFLETGGRVPILRPFQLFRMRGASKKQEHVQFRDSFGFPTDPFPTILAGVVTPFAFWFEDDPFGGCIRFPTERETERMMGLPEGWTEYGADGKPISSTQRYRALGNSIALPCADYLMAGIAEVLGKEKIASHRETQNGR